MPEAPEVEVISRQLASLLVGSQSMGGASFHPKFQRVAVDGTLLPPLPVGTVKRLWRHGKWLNWVIATDGGDKLIRMNLGMSGRFVVAYPDRVFTARVKRKWVKWTARFIRDGVRLRLLYADPRCMGRLTAADRFTARDVTSLTALSTGVPAVRLGPDWLSGAFAQFELPRCTTFVRRALCGAVTLKDALMDQARLAGLGNIYSCEGCFAMRTHPHSKPDVLTRRQFEMGAAAIPKMLQTSVRLGGTSFGDANTYKDLYGKEGINKQRLFVYGRAGKLCRVCQTPIIKIKTKGRSTFLCPKCQPLQG